MAPVTRSWYRSRALLPGAVLAGATAFVGPVHARQGASVDELAAQATDPTASLMSFQPNDWYTGDFHGIDDSLNLGVNYGQVVSFTGHKWRPNVEVDHDFKDDYGNPKWTIRAGIVLLLPTS
jgi:hypothetical protein